MTAEDRIKNLCNVMSVYHDCNFSLHRAMEGEEYYNVVDIGNILIDDDVLLKVRSSIDNFIINEIMNISTLIDRWYVTNFMSNDYANFTNYAYEGDWEECIKIWKNIFNKITEIAKENPKINEDLKKWTMEN